MHDDLKELIELGMHCPSCKSNDLRDSDGDPQSLESFVCNKCGFRWLEDVYPDDDDETGCAWGVGCRFWKNQIKSTLAWKNFNQRLIWVSHSADKIKRAGETE